MMMNNYERIEIFLLYKLHCNIDLKSLQHQLQICKDKLNITKNSKSNLNRFREIVSLKHNGWCLIAQAHFGGFSY
ncbi:hypothetical protein BJN41_09575 [Acinetobacter towneri]|uniref:Uncharacterized protein n=1 Tax=Acinetobacter towneri TaxID=202956 RepID=A0A1E8E0Z0_9GAMM|nr:hypothetical protein BJN41_09575 [Acinetobacter towneri]